MPPTPPAVITSQSCNDKASDEHPCTPPPPAGKGVCRKLLLLIHSYRKLLLLHILPHCFAAVPLTLRSQQWLCRWLQWPMLE